MLSLLVLLLLKVFISPLLSLSKILGREFDRAIKENQKLQFQIECLRLGGYFWILLEDLKGGVADFEVNWKFRVPMGYP